MVDEPIPTQVAEQLNTAQEQKHGQRYLGAIAAFLTAEKLILSTVPPGLREGATNPRGPEPAVFARLARAFFTAGAELALQATSPSGVVQAAALRGSSAPQNRPQARLTDDFTDAERRRRGQGPALLQQSLETLGASSEIALDGRSMVSIADVAREIASRVDGGSSLAVAPLVARADPPQIPVELGRFYYGDIPLGVGECLVQLGQQFDTALQYYDRALHYPYTDPPFETADLWLRLAEAYLAAGDAAYRSGDVQTARAKYEVILKGGAVPTQSPLYQGSLAIMVARVRFWVTQLSQDPATQSPAAVPPRQLAALALVKQRLVQLDASLDFFGHPPSWRPIFSFAYLREAARTFAQFAAQANREYVAYTQRAEDQTQNVQQMEQAVALGEASIQVDLAHVNEVQAEIGAATEAARLAQTRAQLARDNLATFQTLGWDRARLDSATAWSSAASVGEDDEVRQTYGGLEDLGIRGTMNRSDLLHELAWQRETRSFDIEKDRLANAVIELDAATIAANAQTSLAQSRLPAALASVDVARWRNHFARVNLDAARSRETSPELFFGLAQLVRDTARIYLDRAVGVALAMEQAYNFENTTTVKRIRSDYGDLAGVGNLYAADFLLRDIDAFLFDSVLQTTAKSQLVIRFLSLRREFPLQYADFLRTGTMVFQTTLDQFHGDAPGTYNARIKRVAVEFVGMSTIGGMIGSLTCAGVSAVRLQDGTVTRKVHPSESLVLSPLAPSSSLARLDTTSLTTPAGETAVFENVGVQCSWRLDVPIRFNEQQLSTAADVGLVIAYLWQHDPGLDQRDRENLPAIGHAETTLSLREQGRDSAGVPVIAALTKQGTAAFEFPADWLPRYVTQPAIQDVSAFCIRKSGGSLPLVLRLWSTTAGDPQQVFRPDADAITRVERHDAPGGFHNVTPAQSYRIGIDPAQNPVLAGTAPNVLDLTSVQDIFIVIAYQHGYR